MNILKIPECDCCLGEESVSACTYLATNMRRMNKTWLPVLIFYVSITCGCYEGHVLSVVVHVGGHVSVLLDCVYLSRIHAQPHCWANMHVVTAAVTSTGLRQTPPGSQNALGRVSTATKEQSTALRFC